MSAELRRRVLIEAGHRCAIPTCRHIEVDVHHIIPWNACQQHQYENLIALCPNCHRLADKGQIDRKALLTYKANLRFMHDRFSQFEVDFLFEAYGLPADLMIMWPTGLTLLLKRLIDAGYLEAHVPSTLDSHGVSRFVRTTRRSSAKSTTICVEQTMARLALTEAGRVYIESLGIAK